MLTNVFQLKDFEGDLSATPVSLDGLPDESGERYGAVQAIVSKLCSKNLDAAAAARRREADVVLLESTDLQENMVSGIYESRNPSFGQRRAATEYEVKKAWENRVRTFLSNNGFQRVGRKYVVEDELLDDSIEFKRAYEVQADVIEGVPSVAVDPCTRVMEPVTDEMVWQADRGDGVAIRTLPKWRGGELVGRSESPASEHVFEHHGVEKPTPRYWRDRHGVGFVDGAEEMLDVYVADFDKELSYPRSCVFGAYSRGRSLPDDLKKGPKDRVAAAVTAVEEEFESMVFARSPVEFTKAKSPSLLGWGTHDFGGQHRFDVRVGDGAVRNVSGIHKGLQAEGPYSGAVNGKYVVIAPDDSPWVRSGFNELEQIYAQLNLGDIERWSAVGEDGVIEVGDIHSNAYANRITQLRPQLSDADDLIAFVVLPPQQQSEVYFQARGKLFERLFGSQPVSAQAIKQGNVRKLARDDGYFIGVNTASQAYVKLGTTGSAVWILDEPADAHVPGVTPGGTCYAYHDVSRRPEKNASSTAYSATTDSFGRYIATGAKPSGGERLTDEVFHDILNELLRKVAAFHRRQEAQGEMDFHFERLVFAKDGRVTRGEEAMMREVIRNGVPDEGRRAIETILRDDDLLPEEMIIDVVSVNKSANRRLIERRNSTYTNVDGGTAVTYSDDSGLLVSHKPGRGTAQPLEISLHDHISLNQSPVPDPTAAQLLEEYHSLSHLNWSSIFKQGKFALPQILTQQLGENLSAGIDVPENMPMI
jgi:hypothetical protein